MKLKVKVVPGASRNDIVGWLEDSLKLRVTAPPEKGKANRAVSRLLAKALQLPPDQVEIVAGTGSAHKVIEITPLSEHEVFSRLDKPYQGKRP